MKYFVSVAQPLKGQTPDPRYLWVLGALWGYLNVPISVSSSLLSFLYDVDEQLVCVNRIQRGGSLLENLMRGD